MAAIPDLGAALETLARGAAGARVRVRGLTTEQVAHGLAHSLRVTEEGLTAGVMLTVRGSGGATLRTFMVGRDTLDDPRVVLG